VTKVIKRTCQVLWLVAWCGLISITAAASPQTSKPAGNAAPFPTTAETLYQRVSTVGLDPARVYQVREAQITRGSLQISLYDGTIAFTEDVAGHVTGAFFEGDGEVLLAPPDQTERASMALFTGAAILEEHFATGYFRFNDDTFADLRSWLRPAEDSSEFVSKWNPVAKNLAGSDALRLLLSFSQLLPSAGNEPRPSSSSDASDRMLHARLQGRRLGTFDLYFDSEAAEQIWAGQLKVTGVDSFFDVWTSFTLRSPGEHRTVNGITGEEGKVDTIRVLKYRITAEITPPTTVNAEATLDMEVQEGGQRAALFELSRFLKITKLQADDKDVEFIHNQAIEGTQLSRRGNDLVAVIFPAPLRTGQKVKLHVVYGGEVLSEAGGGLLYVGARGTWYPNRGLAMADYDLEFHYPDGWTLLATGRRVESSSGPAGTEPHSGQVSRWASDRPIPLAGFNLGRYSRADARAGNIPVETYAALSLERAFPKAQAEIVIPEIPTPPRRQPSIIVRTPPPPSPAQSAGVLAERAAQAIDFFSERFGPYPYSHLALTQMPGNLSQGWPGLVFLSSISFLTPEEEAQLHMSELHTIESALVVPHETAHQWWGDLIVWSSYRDQWMVEALANYSALMFLESKSPTKFRTVIDNYRSDLLTKNKDELTLLEAGPVTLGSRLSNSRLPEGYEAVSYGRGTWLLHMLRCMLRDGEMKPGASEHATATDSPNEPFVRALRKLRERYEGKSLSSKELLDVFAEDLPPALRYEGHKSLDWFYDGWVNGSAIPRFELQGVKYLDKGATTLISGTILQKDAPGNLVSSVPIYATVNSRMVFVGRVFTEGNETSFHLNAPAGARRVVLDPKKTLLQR